AALWAGLLFAVSPFSIHYTTYLRSFALVTLLSTLALEIALRRWSDPDAASDRWPIAYAFAMAAALYTFYFAAAYWLALALVGGLVLRRSGLLRGWLLANGAVALLFAPWVPVLLQQRRSLAGEAMGLETLAPGAVGHRLLEVLAQLPGNLLTYGLSLPALVTVLMGVVLMVVFVRTVAAAQGAATAAPAVPLLAVPLVAFGLILVAFVPGNAYLQERYSFLLLPPLWIALALALDRIADQPRRAIGAVLGLLYLGGYLGLLQTPGEDFRGAARYLAASVPDRAPVWVIAGFCEVPLAHYWPAGADHLEGLPSFDPDQPQAIPAMVDRLRQLQRDRVSELWVVVSHDQRGAQR
ncbi:MAG TPA: hypothetical protein VEI97_18675, partial [bacterium]|nr:hypothetical protein [bacterium]